MKTPRQIQLAMEGHVIPFFQPGEDGLAIMIQKDGLFYKIIASWGGRWDHVSVSLEDRCPTWDEMCWVKDLFWNAQETAIQYHPAKSDYINVHDYCLHLWKPQKRSIPQPPKRFVG